MLLHNFLILNRDEILKISEEKTKRLAGPLVNSAQLNLGLPLFYEQLIKVLEYKLQVKQPEALILDAAEHGKEFLRLGYSLSHVVHAYGAMCQAITELATRKNANISSSEFNILNGCLDSAIASAVSEYQFRSVQSSDERELLHLGSLAHELRNALSSATVAHDMIKAGMVGTGGSTAVVLELNLSRMRNLIDLSLSEVRMRADSDVVIEKFRLSDLFDQILMTAKVDAKKRSVSVICEADWKIEVEADRQFLLSAIANVVQNAIKYTKVGGTIWVRAIQNEDRILIEVEDQCGGIEDNKFNSLFNPYTQANQDKTGLGLGLTISRRAIQLSQGKITVKNNPGTGCQFTIDIPQKLIPGPTNKVTVPGIDSVQPDISKKPTQ